MKTILFTLMFMLVISLNTGTVMAQCVSPYSVPVYYNNDPFSNIAPAYCVGSGNHYEGASPVAANGLCYTQNTGNPSADGSYCNGTCVGQLFPDQTGICMVPPCNQIGLGPTWDWNFTVEYTTTGDYYYSWDAADILTGCDPDVWSKIKLAKPGKPEIKDAWIIPYRPKKAES